MCKRKNISIDSLIDTSMIFLQKQKLADITLFVYKSTLFGHVKKVYRENGEMYYNESLMENILSRIEADLKNDIISKNTYDNRYKGVKILQEVFETGSYERKTYTHHPHVEPPSQFAKLVCQFKDNLDLNRLNDVEMYKLFTKFLVYIAEKNIDDIRDVTGDDIQAFLVEMRKTRPKSMDKVITSLRRLKSCYEEQTGYKLKGPWLLLISPRSRDKKVKHSVPDIIIEDVFKLIDTSNPPGKRDFAIMCLDVYSGLRAGDIANLTIENIDFSQNQIVLIQGKTQHRLILPMDAIVKSSIADYILHERPMSKEKKIFLTCNAPYTPFHDGVGISNIFKRYLKRAGYEHQTGDGLTFHGLRRALATNMVQNGISVDTVAQVLGHSQTGSTKQYISLDIENLKMCSLSFDSLEIQ